MIEFLSDSSWLSPQIDFLLFLQNIRDSHFRCLDDLFLSITIIGEFWLPMVICAIVYWCIDFKSGIYMFSMSSAGMFIAHILKILACVYRPWILSDKIHPVQKALLLAPGYSFPSGHSAQASSLLGGLAFILRKKAGIAMLLILIVLMVGFSRMWLGVHTPQDVVVGLLIGFSLVFIVNSAINWAEKDKNRYLYILGLVNVIIIAAIIQMCYFNHYPVDYVDGKLLVNPYHSIQITIFCHGCISGILSGLCICRRYFPFDSKEGSLLSKILRGTIGSVFIIFLFKTGVNTFFSGPCDYKIVFALSFFSGFFITAIYPFIFSKLLKLKK